MTARLFYIDDSGAEQSGCIVYSWVQVDIREWATGLRGWLDWRHSLSKSCQIPVLAEIHATKFLGGRGRPSLDEEWNFVKENRWRVTEEALATVSAMDCLSVGTVHRKTRARRRAFALEKAQTYEALVHLLDERLTAQGELGVIVMDGEGTDPSYFSAHRNLKLATRSIVEDPFFQHSHTSQWVQIADIVAYVAYQHLYRAPGKEFAWGWYTKYLSGCDVLGGPREV